MQRKLMLLLRANKGLTASWATLVGKANSCPKDFLRLYKILLYH